MFFDAFYMEIFLQFLKAYNNKNDNNSKAQIFCLVHLNTCFLNLTGNCIEGNAFPRHYRYA